jgi:hypothetical protein
MGLQTRIVVMRPDHRNDIFVLKPKKLEGKKFTHKNCAYLINDEHFQITTDAPWWRLWMFKRYFTTYYYVQGQTNPLPVPSFNGTIVKGGIDSEELAAIFNPWFYRTIAAPVKDLWAQIQFYISIATLLGVLFTAYKLYSMPAAAPTGP